MSTTQILNKMVGKDTRDPKIILKWSLIFLKDFLEIIWGLFGKRTKNKK
jgi:hypothetical protein